MTLRTAVGHRRRAELVGRWLLLLVALGGLLAMHGFSDHGVGGPGAVASSEAEVPADAHTHSGAHDVGGDGAGGSSGGHGDHHGGLVVGMCLAVLAAGLLLGATWRRAGLTVRLRRALADPVVVEAATAVRARARGPAPPDLRLLSIQRC
ncbi:MULTISPECIES: DUF6153 family protein [unclassified Nocardioides]|uniref:DUF6153 family protein n=1 Tax=unclassified Nocardioides TaxID=2615069 RepID=UPI00361D6E46